MRVLPPPRAPASTLLLAQPPRLLPPSTLTATLPSSSPAPTCPPLLPLPLSTAIFPPLPPLLLQPELSSDARGPSVGDVRAAAARAFTSIARDRMLSLRDSLLELNSGVARADFAPTRLAATRQDEAALPPNVLMLPLSKGCTARSRSLPQHFE